MPPPAEAVERIYSGSPDLGCDWNQFGGNVADKTIERTLRIAD